nr:PLP-dependent transferase [Rhodothermus marinus]
MYHDRIHLETLLAKAGCVPDPATGAVVSPPYLSTTFERAPDGSYPHGYIYSRHDNPTRHQLEDTLAHLEGGQACAPSPRAWRPPRPCFRRWNPEVTF